MRYRLRASSTPMISLETLIYLASISLILLPLFLLYFELSSSRSITALVVILAVVTFLVIISSAAARVIANLSR